MFRADGRPVEVAGNIGRPLTLARRLDRRRTPGSSASSSSSSSTTSHVLRPRIGVLLNLEPDHLDRHGTSRRTPTKLRIFAADGGRRRVRPARFGPFPGAARRIEFSGDDALPAEPTSPAHTTGRTQPPPPRPPGPPESTTTRSPRRCALSRACAPDRADREHPRCPLVNDSKATNVAAALRALASFPDDRLHVILGGLGSTRGTSRSLRLSGRATRIRDGGAGEESRVPSTTPVPVVRARDARGRARRRGGEGRPGGRRPALARLCELRPVPGLRGTRRRVPLAGGGPA